MFSRTEKKQLSQEFWTVFGKSFPKKWILYDTRIKDLSFKFFADERSATVSMDLEMREPSLRALYFEKLMSLENLMREDLGAIFISEDLILDNGKEISRFWFEKSGVSIYRKETWRDIFEFFVEKMTALENFFLEYEDFIR